MAQKKAFVRYANNKAVPGSLIVRTKAPSVGNWKEVTYDLCCSQTTIIPIPEVQIQSNPPGLNQYSLGIMGLCFNFPSEGYDNRFLYWELSPITAEITTTQDLIDVFNEHFSFLGTFTLLTPTTGSLQINNNYLPGIDTICENPYIEIFANLITPP